MKYVLFYENTPDFREKAMEIFPRHRARLDEFHGRGVLLMVGPFTDDEGGAMGIFTSREEAEAFAKDDPFVLGGVVASWKVREWREVFG